MEAVDLHVPFDFERFPEFEEFARLWEDKEKATAIWLRIWVWLAYQSRLPSATAATFGVCTEQARERMWASLGVPTYYRKLFWERIIAAGIAYEVSNGLQFPRFRQYNEHLSPNYLTAAKSGNLYRNYRDRVRRARKEQDTQLPDDLFTNPDGTAMPPLLRKRIVTFIRLCDNALMLSDRQPQLFTGLLIQNALAIITAYSDEQIECVCYRLVRLRRNPTMPQTTEELLPKWPEIADAVLHDKQSEEPLPPTPQEREPETPAAPTETPA